MRTSLCVAACIGVAVASPELLKLDFTKAAVPGARLGRRAFTVPLENDLLDERYLVDFTIGTPGQKFSLLLDTGSSDTWVAASDSPGCAVQDACAHGVFDPSKSSTYVATGSTYNNTYGIPGQESTTLGTYFTDVLTIGDATIKNMTMALVNATKSVTQYSAVIGILAVGPPLAESIVSEVINNGSATTLVQAEADEFPTIYDQLATAGYSSRRAFSVWLNDQMATAGSILFGGIDTTKYSGDLISLPIQLTNGLFAYYTVAMTSLTLNSTKLGSQLLTSADFAAVVDLDTGTPTMALPMDLANGLIQGLGGITTQSGVAFVDCALRDLDDFLIFGFGGEGGPKIAVPFSALILPYNEYNATDAGVKVCQLGVGGSSAPPYTLGDTFMRSAYVVYDVDNQQIAMAQAKHNVATSNIIAIPSGTGLPGVTSTATFMMATGTASELSTAKASQSAVATSAGSASITSQVPSPTFSLGTTLSSAAASATASSTGSSAGVRVAPFTAWSGGAGLLAAVLSFLL